MDPIESNHFEQLFAKLANWPIHCAGGCGQLVQNLAVVAGEECYEVCSLSCATRIAQRVQQVTGRSTTIKKV